MSAQSGCGCSAASAAASQGTLPAAPSAAVTTDSGQDSQCPCPSSSAGTSPSRPEHADTAAQQDQPRKTRKRKGSSNVYTQLKGRMVDIPGWVFEVDVPELYYRGRVMKKDGGHKGCVVLRTEDGGKYFFPVEQVTAWLDDMQHRSSPQPGSTLGTACDRFAAETLASMSLSAATVSEGSAGEDDAGTPARTTLRRVQAQAAARRALLPSHPGQQRHQEEEEQQQEVLRQQARAPGNKRRQQQPQGGVEKKAAGAGKQKQQQGKEEGGMRVAPVVLVDASGALLQGVPLGQHRVADKGQQGELGKRKRGAADSRREVGLLH